MLSSNTQQRDVNKINAKSVNFNFSGQAAVSLSLSLLMLLLLAAALRKMRTIPDRSQQQPGRAEYLD